jgi:DNA-binding IclR family transcriptional regulator
MDLIQEARQYVDAVSEELDMTGFIAMLEGNQIIYLYKREPEKVPIYTANVGNREDAYCTSLGKAILSALPGEELQPLLQTLQYRRRTRRTIMNTEALMKDLSLTRRRGYSLDDREILDFVMCVGAPIFDHSGHVTGGISIAGLYEESRNPDREGFILKKAAQAISRRLGYTGGGDTHGPG